MTTADDWLRRFAPGLRVGRVPIGGLAAVSVDLRHRFGGSEPDATALEPPGTFSAALLPWQAGQYPIGELRLLLGGREVRVVASPTGRHPNEYTPEHLAAALRDPAYRAALAAAAR